MSDEMTDHEKAAMEAAIARLIRDCRPTERAAFKVMLETMWETARKYEPPAVCGERCGEGGLPPCVLHTGHDCDHRTGSNWNNSYIGWPREQEADPDERCAYIMQEEPFTGHPCNGLRKMHGSGHAFVSAKEATK